MRFLRHNQKQWVINLLHYCLSDNCKNLRGLPLALLANGTLQTFGYNPPGFIYMADKEAMQLFTSYPEWFLSPDLLNQRFIIPENTQIGILRMTPIEVAKRLRDVISPNQVLSLQWQPNSKTLPNARWLAQVYRYLAAEVRDLPIEELREVPLVPGNDGSLHRGGYDATPLWCGSSVEQETLETLAYFGVSLVQAKEPLRDAIAQFLNRHPEELIWHLTVSDLIDTLASKATALPSYNERLYKALVSFLADRHWINGQGKNDQDKQDKLRKLPIFPTTDNHPVALQNQNVYSPGGYIPPRVAGPLKLLCLGPSLDSQEWKSLFDLLKVPVLDHATLIRKCLLPGYVCFDAQQQLEALEWIRDNLSTAQTQLDKQGQNSSELKKQISGTALIRCTDGNLRPASSIYTPNSYELVRQVIGDRAHTPDMHFYARGREHWLEFFRELRMRTTPSPDDLLAHVDGLIRKGTQVGVDAVTKSLMDVFYHIESNWDKLETAKVTGENKTLVEALKTRAWLPVERQEERLKRFPSFRIPTARLYRADEVCLVQYGHLVASQKPILTVREPKSEVQKALGFRIPDRSDVVNHFKVLIDLWGTGDTSNINDKDFQRSLDSIYRYFSNTFLGSKATDTDKRWLRTQLAGRKCLWDYVEFWQPGHAFQDSVSFFGKRRTKINPPSPIREVFELLGQKRSPDINDYLAFLDELAEDSKGNSLDKEDTKCAFEVLKLLARDLEYEDRSAEDLDLLLLTDDFLLLPADQILIPDAPWRLECIRDRSKVKILHPEIPHNLAISAGSRSLLRDVEEQPRTVNHTADPEANRFCQKWQSLLRSPEFKAGLERLIFDRHGLIESVDIDWLRWTIVLPAEEIVTELLLDSEFIASDVPGNYYFEPEHRTFYLRFDDEDTMRYYLAESLNNQLEDCKLEDKSRLMNILNVVNPTDIERRLNQLGVRDLKKPTQEDVTLVGEDLPEDQIFDPEITQEWEDFAGITEQPSYEATNTAVSEQVTARATERTNGRSQRQDSANSAPTAQPRQAGTNSAPTAQPQQTGAVPAPTAQPRQASTPGTPISSTPAASTPPKSQIRGRNILNLAPFLDNLQNGVDDDEDLDKEVVTPSNGGNYTGKLFSGTSNGSRSHGNGQISGRNRTGGSTFQPRTQQGRLRTYVHPKSGTGAEPNLEEQYPQEEREKIDRAGMARVMQYEREQGRNPEAMLPNHPGYDIESKEGSGKIRYVEVKSIRGDWGSRGVKLTRTQFETAQNFQEKYWLYVVERAEDDEAFQVLLIQNPALRVGEFFYDDGWREVAEN